MTDYYHHHARAYYNETVALDPAPFLNGFIRQLSAGDHVLDVGCGSGRDLLWMQHKDLAVTGFERSPELARMARRHAGCRVIEGDFTTYDFAPLAVDAILMTGALVHVPHGRLLRVLKHILLALNPASPRRIVYLSLKEGKGEVADRRDRVFYFWQEADLAHLLSEAGLEILHFQRSLSADGTGQPWLGFVLHHHAAR